MRLKRFSRIKVFAPSLGLAVLVSFLLVGEVAAICPDKPQAQQSVVETGPIRLSQASPACTEGCMSQCRAAERSCSGDRSACRAQFQICARRCVVSCGAR